MTHITIEREALQTVQEALEKLTDTEQTYEALDLGDKAITAIKQALAAPVQEPVAWMRTTDITELTDSEPEEDGYTPLYTTLPAQPAPVPVEWMEMVTANLVREGVNKHKARELAEHFYSLAPAAQRQWRGLTDKEFEEIIMSAPNATVPVVLWQLIQDKLKEKNT